MSLSSTESLPIDDRDNVGAISYRRYAGILGDRFRRYHRLLAILMTLSVCGGTIAASVIEPEYTATAILGAAPSPFDDLTSMTGGISGALGSGITKKLGLGGRGGNSDLFDQYVELLNSNRLAGRLAADPNIMRAMFPRKYDWQNHRWAIELGPVVQLKNVFKVLFHIPIKEKPDRDDVTKYLDHNVTVDAPLTSSFVTVSLASTSPEKASWLLDTMLADADALIRNDRRRDVGARIEYLAQTLPAVTQSDQRQSLSTILSDQQQTMMMIRADKRYASALVDPPHAPLVPTSPRLVMVFSTAFLIAIVVWGLLVLFLPAEHWLLYLSFVSSSGDDSPHESEQRQPKPRKAVRNSLVPRVD